MRRSAALLLAVAVLAVVLRVSAAAPSRGGGDTTAGSSRDPPMQIIDIDVTDDVRNALECDAVECSRLCRARQGYRSGYCTFPEDHCACFI
ncbi:hypothetical protein ONE63_005388 [Megalurothrips usitatus]|uniref:Uncharacterized protein n=1 Tax=Megalurothrips usitatus TaxID=439358 RepID=A0AAV7XYR9_9NEOP|nr:hypothetical protein ONE63_005388 [Megalurothrips usitatus]